MVKTGGLRETGRALDSSDARSAMGDFLDLCRRVGADPLLAQASGGNVSVKADGRLMLVKATGARLRDIRRASGWVWADLPRLRTSLSPSPGGLEDDDYSALVGSASLFSKRLCSLESGFHAVLGARCVTHVHSLAGILAGMLPGSQGRELARSALAPGVGLRFVAACSPGLDLCRRVAASERGNGGPALWILENHGIICADSSPAALSRTLAGFEGVARRYFGLGGFHRPHRLRSGEDGSRSYCFCGWRRFAFSPRPYFPDFVVYFGLDREFPRCSGPVVTVPGGGPGDAGDERDLLFAHAVISTVASLGSRSAFLPESVIAAIRSQRTERRRVAEIRRGAAGGR